MNLPNGSHFKIKRGRRVRRPHFLLKPAICADSVLGFASAIPDAVYYAKLVDLPTPCDCHDAYCLRYGSRPRQINQGMAQRRADLWAARSFGALGPWRSQRQSSKDGAPNWGRAGRQMMASNFIKIFMLAGLVIITCGVLPNRRVGAFIAIGTCITAALVLHFVAP